MFRVFCRGAAWLLLAAILVVTLSPIGWRPVTGAPADLERLVAFGVLGIAFSLGYPKHRALILLLLVCVAGSSEALQSLVPTRDARMADAAVKALGGVMGVFAGRVASR